MTSSTGKDPDRGGLGFTLIELLLVVTILGVILSLSAPRFRRSYETLALKNAAFDLYQFLHFARGHALAQRRPMKVQFDFDRAAYRLLEEKPTAEENSEPSALPRFEPVAGRFGRAPDAKPFWTLEGDRREIICRPNGNCDAGAWRLQAAGERFEVSVEAVTSEIILREPTSS